MGEKEKGPNTGGMGAYSPAPIINKNLEKKIINKIVNPTLLALKNKKKPYALIAKTIKGNPISFMKNVPLWHYRAPNKKEFEDALIQIKKYEKRI